nr:winged helix-turn-helix domain-containing protein [Candidatus Freyarchaeota archaeon]
MTEIVRIEVEKVLELLASGPRYPSGIAEELGMSKKTVFRTVKILEESGLVDVFSPAERRVGRPRKYLSVTERGWRLLEFIEELKLQTIMRRFKRVVFGPGYSLLEYGIPLVNFGAEFFTIDEVQEKLLVRGVEGFVWRDEDVYRRARLSSFEPRIPVLSVEDTVLCVLLFLRRARYVEAMPTLIALHSKEIDYDYLFEKGNRYNLVEIVGFFLDIADHLRPCRELKLGCSPFRRARTRGKKRVFPRAESTGRFGEALIREKEEEFDPTEVYSWYWRVEGAPRLEEFEKFFETYTRTRRGREDVG